MRLRREHAVAATGVTSFGTCQTGQQQCYSAAFDGHACHHDAAVKVPPAVLMPVRSRQSAQRCFLCRSTRLLIGPRSSACLRRAEHCLRSGEHSNPHTEVPVPLPKASWQTCNASHTTQHLGCDAPKPDCPVWDLPLQRRAKRKSRASQSVQCVTCRHYGNNYGNHYYSLFHQILRCCAGTPAKRCGHVY